MPDTDELFKPLIIESDEDSMRKRKIDEIYEIDEIDEMIDMLNKFIKIYDLTDKEDSSLSNKTEKILLDSGLLTSKIEKNTEIDEKNL